MKTLEHGMLLRSKSVMDDAMCELAELRELVPARLHGELDKVLAQFEDTLCECDVADEYVRRDRIARLQESNAELLASCRAAQDAMAQEFLYQTGQTVRPQANYPPQGTVCGQLSDAMELLVAAIKKADAQE